MRRVREGDVVKALTVAKDNYRFVGSRIAPLSRELFGEYVGCMALGHCNPGLISRFSAGLLDLTKMKSRPEVLVVILASDSQLPAPRGPVAARNLEDAFPAALEKAASTQPEIEFSKSAIADLWSRRRAERELVEGRPKPPQMFVTELSKLSKFVTKNGKRKAI